MKKLSFAIIAAFLLCVIWSSAQAGPSISGPGGGGGGVLTDTNCNQAKYFAIGTLCQDTDDALLYKGITTGVTEVTSGSGTGDMAKATYDADANSFVDLGAGGTNTGLADPGADRIMFWDDSGTVVNWLQLDTGLSITATTLSLDAELVAFVGLTSAANKLPYYTGLGTASLTDFSAVGRGIVQSGTTELARTALGVTIGTDVQAYDADLLALAGLTSAANKLPYFTGAGTAAVTDFSAVGRGIVQSGTTEIARSSLGLAIGTNVQAYDAELAAVAGLTSAADKLPYFTGSETAAVTDLSAVGRGIIQSGTTPIARVALGLGFGSGVSTVVTFSGGDFIDMSGVTMSAGTDQGIAIPWWVDVAPATEKFFMAYDPAGNALYVREPGGWVNVGASAAAPTTAHYVVTVASGNLTEESVIAEGLAIDITDAGGDGGNITIAFDPTELTGDRTWAAGGAATVAWTWDVTGTDPVITFGNGYVNISTGKLLSGGTDVYVSGATDVYVTDGGTGKSSWTPFGLVYPDTAVSFSQIAVGTSGQVLRSGGAAAAAWSTATYPTTSGTSSYFLRSNGTNIVSTSHSLTLDDIADGSSFQRVAAADVSASGHVNRWQVADTAGYATLVGPTGAIAITVDDAAQELAARNRTNTFTENNTFGNANTDTLTIQSLIIGSGRAVTIASSSPSPTYASGVSELYVGGDVEVGGTVYSAGGFVSTGLGDSYISLLDNAAYGPASGYQIYFEAGSLKVYDGTEKNILDTATAPTLTGATWSFASVTNLVLPHGNSATADATGEIAFDDDDDRLVFQIGATQRYFDFTGDAASYVLKSDGSGHFTLQADETGTTPYWSSLGNPTAALALTFESGETTSLTFTGAFAATQGSQFLIEQKTGNPGGGTMFEVKVADTDVSAAKIGDGTNAILISSGGGMTLAGTASITAGGVVLGDSTADGAGEIGYASNAFTLAGGAGPEIISLTLGTDLATFDSSTSAKFAFTPQVRFASGVTVDGVLFVHENIYPAAANTIQLGSGTSTFADLFLGDGAVVNFNNGDVTVTHATNALNFAGASVGYDFDSGVTATRLWAETDMIVPTGAAPTVPAVAGAFALDTTASQIVVNSGVTEQVIAGVTQFQSITISGVTSVGDTDDHIIMTLPYNITIKEVSAKLRRNGGSGGTGITTTINVQECTPANSCTDMIGTDWVLSGATTATLFKSAQSDFTDSVGAKKNEIRLDVVSGCTDSDLTVGISYWINRE